MKFTFTLLIVLISIQPTLNFEFPSIEEFFGNLLKKSTPKVKSESKERVKRQNPNIGDDSPLAYEVRSQSLPMLPDDSDINYRYMPVMGNGHISTTVYSPDLYLNGLYNGIGGDSHRAAIPATIMTRLTLSNEQEEGLTTRYYSFNVDTGVFTETIDCPFAVVEHKTYVHQKYIRVLVTDISVEPKGNDGGQLLFNYREMEESPDINFNKASSVFSLEVWNGQTQQSEEGEPVQTVSVLHTTKSLDITVIPNQNQGNITMLMAVDKIQSNAQADILAARDIYFASGSYALLLEHMNAWKETWDRGLIEVEGNLQQSKLVRFSQYYLMSAMPAYDANLAPPYNEIFYGPTRTSLGKGGQGKDYRGHMFWDTEMYILPVFLLFHPEKAKEMLRYRASKRPEAEQHAASFGQQGLRYPWESAYSGNDVTPDACMQCRDEQIFTSGAVSWSIRQYYSATRDNTIFTDPEYLSCDLSRDIAAFYAGLATYNSSKGRYDIKGVMGPDDFHPNTNNNAFTNVIASLAIHWARYFSCICGRNENQEVPAESIQKALYLDLPYSNVERVHYQYEGYNENQNKTIKQADTILLTYPLAWNMSRDIMRNDLQYYEPFLSGRTPAMTHSFMVVGWKFVEEFNKMENSFFKSYDDYLIQPFKIWTEYNEQNWNDQEAGSVNFLPGMGGYLQSLIYGYAGVRLRPEALEFHNPMPPTYSERMTLNKFKYLGTVMDIVIESSQVSINVISTDNLLIDLKRNESNAEEEPLTDGAYILIENPGAGFFLYPRTQSSCEHPRDYIHMPWGYSPWLSGAPQCNFSAVTIFATIFLSVFINFQMR